MTDADLGKLVNAADADAHAGRLAAEEVAALLVSQLREERAAAFRAMAGVRI